MINTYTQINYYIIIITKYKVAIFDNEPKRADLTKILQTLADKTDLQIKAIDVTANQINLQISFPPTKSLTDVIKNIKGYSARNWFKKHPETKIRCHQGHLWAPSFYSETIGKTDIKRANNFIASQTLTPYKKAHLRTDY